MRSKTDLFNMALYHIGSTFVVADADTEDSKEARTCRQFYDISRQSVLSDLDWSFNRMFQNLAVIDGEEHPHYKYVYKLPTNCLLVRSLAQPLVKDYKPFDATYSGDRLMTRSIPERLRVPFETGIDSMGETRTLTTNLEDAQIEYSADIQNMNLLIPNAFDALAIRLAMYIAMPVSASPGIAQQLGSAYQLALQTAAAQDMNASQQPMYPEPESITSRIS